MSIEHCDNWSIYGANPALMTNGVWASIGSSGFFVADPDGVSPGLVWKPITTFFYNLRYVLAQEQQIVGHANRIYYSILPVDADHYANICSFYDITGNIAAYVGVNPTGSFTLYTPQGGGPYTTPGPVITANGWWHVECKLDFGAAQETGSFEIRVEGVQVLLETGLTFSGAPPGYPYQRDYGTMFEYNFKTVFTSGSPAIYYKDFVLWNGSGTQNNDFLGTVLVTSLLPTADVSLNWTPTPNTDTGAQILATAPPQDGVVYLDAPNPPPAPYVGTFEHLTGDITSVKCVMTFVRAAKVDGGDGSLQVGLISSPASAPETTLGANRPITTSPTYWRDVFELDPKTAAEWLPSAVNLAELTINRTT